MTSSISIRGFQLLKSCIVRRIRISKKGHVSLFETLIEKCFSLRPQGRTVLSLFELPRKDRLSSFEVSGEDHLSLFWIPWEDSLRCWNFVKLLGLVKMSPGYLFSINRKFSPTWKGVIKGKLYI